MKLKTNRGSALQITLILLLILSLNVFSICQITILNSYSLNGLKNINQQRLLENVLIGYYKYENKNGILLSDYITIDNYTIDYTVDDMGSYFYIETRIVKEDKKYQFNVELNREKNIIQKIEEIT